MIQVKSFGVPSKERYTMKSVNQELKNLVEQGNRIVRTLPISSPNGIYAVYVEYETPEPQEA